MDRTTCTNSVCEEATPKKRITLDDTVMKLDQLSEQYIDLVTKSNMILSAYNREPMMAPEDIFKRINDRTADIGTGNDNSYNSALAHYISKFEIIYSEVMENLNELQGMIS